MARHPAALAGGLMTPAVQALVCAALLASPIAAQEKAPDELTDHVKKSTETAVAALKKAQAKTGGWDQRYATSMFRTGETALVLFALLESGVPLDDPVIDRGLALIRAA